MVRVVPPTERTCERCGRQDRWDADRETWVVAEGSGQVAGNPHCVHEWDITGTYNPLEE